MSDYRLLSGVSPDDYPSRNVAVAMSGGVDSSLAAVLLKEAGFEVIGLTMKLWDFDNSGVETSARGCCDLSTFRDAKLVAASAGIPHYTINLQDEFEQAVVDNFISEYLDGRTPNPCVLCNTAIKWVTFREKARALGCDLIATGHYARIGCHNDDTYSLFRGNDRNKDQTYFLWGLTSHNLASTIFPLGSMTKEQTRIESENRHLKTAQRTESQEICFIPDNDYGRFLQSRVGEDIPKAMTEGDILDISGTVIGTHRGAAFYTVGQRKGLGIALGRPVYVTSVDASTNTVTVGDKQDACSTGMTVGDMNWIRGFPPADEFRCDTQIRYRHRGVHSNVSCDGETVGVTFDTPQLAVTPGQSAVFYDGDQVIGGGVIHTVE
ncbi:tRNA 2-thiouridine(34) synthase MnmA [Candidatus Latescibacterota bacterium]